MANDSKKDVDDRTDPDPHGRDHSEGLAGANERGDVVADERFANSRDEGVVDKRNYLDGLGDALASAVGMDTDDETAEERAGRDRTSKGDVDKKAGSDS